MIDTKIILSIVIVVLIGAAAAGYQISNQIPGLWQPINSQTPDNSQSNTQTGSGTGQGSSSTGSGTGSGTGIVSTSSGSGSTGSGSGNLIGASKAKSIAQTFIKQAGATAGTPRLTTDGGRKVYFVPVILNGQQAGGIYIDAQTGKNLGGEP